MGEQVTGDKAFIREVYADVGAGNLSRPLQNICEVIERVLYRLDALEAAGKGKGDHVPLADSFLTCSVCGRKTYVLDAAGERCGMRQPNGTACGGVLKESHSPPRSPDEIGREIAERLIPLDGNYRNHAALASVDGNELYSLACDGNDDSDKRVRYWCGYLASAISAAITADRKARATRPTREQVAMVAAQARCRAGSFSWDMMSLSEQEGWLRVADAILALFSAPTPPSSAGPVGSPAR